MATLLSLFDGSGGFPLAGALCGITPKYASEVEPYPIAVTRIRFPEMIHLGDVSKVHGWDIDPVDVVTFGSPCQDMSIAGKRAGIKNENVGDEETTRSGLFHEAARIIREMREKTNGAYPAFAVWENVPGAFSSNKGEDFRCVLETLIQIVEPCASMPPVPKGGWPYADCYMGDGWSVAYRTVNAQYWGVPQRRRRIYLVLDLTGQRAGEILFKRPGLRGYFETGGAPWQGTATDAPGGSGAGDRPIPYTLKIRSGCEGGGKGPLIQEDMSATLATNNDQYLFVPVVSAGFKSGQGAQARSIGWEMEKVPTLAAEAGGNSVPSVCVAYSARGNGDGKTAGTITGDHERRPADYTTVVCMATQQGGAEIAENLCPTITAAAGMSGNNQPVLCMEHGQENAEICENCSPCLNCNHEQPIVCGVDCRNMNEYPELYPTLQAKPNGGQSLNFSGAVRICYIVRRLTPTECCRLQGFPDGWGEIDAKKVLSPEEDFFWLEVRQTFDKINGRAIKDYTPKQILDWYNKLNTDSAEYKMWGNGIALPNALYVMQGIQDAIKKR